MDAQSKMRERPQILVWFGGIIIGLGSLFFPLSLIVAIGGFFSPEGGVLSGVFGFFDTLGLALGICGFGLAVARGKRWHLFALLNIVFLVAF